MRATISGLIEAACGYSLLVALAIPFPQPLNQRGQDYRSLSHPYSIPGVAGPGTMRDSMALSPRYLIRMRSECNWLADGRDGPGGDQRSGCCFGGGGGLAGLFYWDRLSRTGGWSPGTRGAAGVAGAAARRSAGRLPTRHHPCPAGCHGEAVGLSADAYNRALA